MSASDSTSDLRDQWKTLYRQRLPSLAKARDPAQPRWPVVLDHCFARIILDNVIGVDRPWDQVIAAPAVQHMSTEQFRKALDLGGHIASGTISLVDLDEQSLALRGKKSKKQQTKRKEREDASTLNQDGPRSDRKKRAKRDEGSISSYFLPSPQSPSPSLKKNPKDAQSKPEPQLEPSSDQQKSDTTLTSGEHDDEDMAVHLDRIRASSALTPFRKLTLSLLCQVPPGRFSTYGAMADFVSTASHKTCARAIGNAMRNNPFAPGVPCHRILAGDGSLGGFKGHWGENGQYAEEKRRLLGEEGVKFDSTGKVKGRPFRGFWMPEGLKT